MQVSGVIPQIRTTDLDESIDFYVSKLGLEFAFRYEDFYAGIKAGDQVFHLKLVDDKDPSIGFVSDGDHFHLYFTTDDVEGKAEEIERKGVSLFKPLSETPWGTKEFAIRDNQGHTLYFGQMTSNGG